MGAPLFKIVSPLLVTTFSMVRPLVSVVALPQRMLCALKSPINSMGFGSSWIKFDKRVGVTTWLGGKYSEQMVINLCRLTLIATACNGVFRETSSKGMLS